MIQVLLLSTVLPALVFGLALALSFWTPLYWRSTQAVVFVLTLIATGMFAMGHVVLAGAPDANWLQATPFLFYLAWAAGLGEAMLPRWRGVQAVLVLVCLGAAVWVFSSPLRSSGTGYELKLLLILLLVSIPAQGWVWRKVEGQQWIRMGWILTLIGWSGILTLCGSALLGQLTGVLVALMCAYFVFAILSKTARLAMPAHVVFIVLSLSFYLLGYFLVEIPTPAWIASGLALTATTHLAWAKQRGWALFLLLWIAILGLNGWAGYAAFAANQ